MRALNVLSLSVCMFVLYYFSGFGCVPSKTIHRLAPLAPLTCICVCSDSSRGQASLGFPPQAGSIKWPPLTAPLTTIPRRISPFPQAVGGPCSSLGIPNGYSDPTLNVPLYSICKALMLFPGSFPEDSTVTSFPVTSYTFSRYVEGAPTLL